MMSAAIGQLRFFELGETHCRRYTIEPFEDITGHFSLHCSMRGPAYASEHCQDRSARRGSSWTVGFESSCFFRVSTTFGGSVELP